MNDSLSDPEVLSRFDEVIRARLTVCITEARPDLSSKADEVLADATWAGQEAASIAKLAIELLPSLLPEATARERNALKAVFKATASETVKDVLSPSGDLLESPHIQDVLPKIQADRLASIVGFGTQKRARVRKAAELVSSGEADSLADTGLSAADAKRISGVVDLYRMTASEEIVRHLVDTKSTSPSDLVGRTEQQWREVIKSTSAELPPGARTTEEYASALTRTIEVAYPTLSLVNRLPVDLPGSGGVRKLVSRMPDVDLRTVDLVTDGDAALSRAGVATTERELVLGQLRSMQRLMAIGNTTAQQVALLNGGFQSAEQISALSLQSFTKQSGLDEEQSFAVYKRAKQMSLQTASSAAAMFDPFTPGRGLDRLDRPSRAKHPDRRLPGIAGLFGSQDFCSCVHCRSILSPAAYFFDLMSFVQQHFGAVPRTAETHPLRTRRPDLLDLRLTCENTTSLVPYLTIVNEVLDSRTRIEAKLSSDESIEAVLSSLNARFSFFAPWNLLPAETDLFLAHFGLSRARLLAVVGKHDEVPRAMLGLSPEQAITIATNDKLKVFDRQKDFADGRIPVPKFCERLGITRSELDDLAALRFSPVGLETIQEPAENDPDKLVRWHEFVASVSGRQLDLVHRFIRLCRATGWSIRQLDTVLVAMGHEDIASETLAVVGRLVGLQQSLHFSVDQLAVLVGDMPASTGYPNVPTGERDRGLLENLFDLQAVFGSDAQTYKLATPYAVAQIGEAKYKESVSAVSAGLAVPVNELGPLATVARVSGPFTRGALSALYRHVLLARALDLPLHEYLEFVALVAQPRKSGKSDPERFALSQENLLERLSAIETLSEYRDWQRASRYSVTDLTKLSQSSDAGLLDLTDTEVRFLVPSLPATKEALLTLGAMGLPATMTEEKFGPLCIGDVRAISAYQTLSKVNAAAVNELVELWGSGSWSEPKGLTALAALSGLAIPVLDSILVHFGGQIGLTPPSGAATDGLTRFMAIALACAALGIDGSDLNRLLADLTTDEQVRARDIAKNTVVATCDTLARRTEVLDPVEARMNEVRRDALVDFLTRRSSNSASRSALYADLLLDIEMRGCARTSRIVAAISSIQLFVHRALLGIEDVTLVRNFEEMKAEWEWRKNFRVWEANRKVFLYPESYVNPELRDDKTPEFTGVEDELSQQQITSQATETAYANYLNRFSDLGRLKVAGSYFDDTKRTYHFFARSTDDPAKLFYRTWNANKQWSHWIDTGLACSSPFVSPIVRNGKLYVFWLEPRIKSATKIEGGTAVQSNQLKGHVRFSLMNLLGEFGPIQSREIFAEVGREVEEDYIEQFPTHQRISVSASDTGFRIEFADVIPRIGYEEVVLKSDDDYLGFPASELTRNDLSEIHKQLLTVNKSVPRGEELRAMLEAWRRVGTDSQKRGYIDALKNGNVKAFRRAGHTIYEGYEFDGIAGLRPTAARQAVYRPNAFVSLQSDNELAVVNRLDLLPPNVELKNGLGGTLTLWEEGGKLVPRPGSAPLNTFPDSWLYVLLNGWILPKSPGARRVLEQFAERYSPPNGSAHLGGPAEPRGHYDQWLPTTRVDYVNNCYETILELDEGQVLFVDRYDRFGPFDGLSSGHLLSGVRRAPYLGVRLTTGVAAELERRLFDRGLEEFISPKTQTLTEPKLPISAVDPSQFTMPWIGSMLPFAGPHGAYMKELFLHTPWLIAQRMNSEGQFESARWWFERIFDPTSPEKVDGKNQVWRYLPFRNLTPPTVKEMLTDQAAIKAYETDPFNPHAIARVRPLAYQKGVVLSYIDNLIDWADARFTEDTTESVNEATMLYMLASEVLGPRPVELGACSSADEHDITYKSLTSKGSSQLSDFLVLLENWVITGAAADSPVPSVASLAAKDAWVRLEQSLSVLAAPTSSPSNPALTKGIQFVDPPNASSEPAVRGVADELTVRSPHRDLMRDSLMVDLPLIELPKFGMKNRPVLAFCIPPNQRLTVHWDRIEDRLFKIRNCMDINGEYRQLDLFEPEIDPMDLVARRSTGALHDASIDQPKRTAPIYRFRFALERARQSAQLVASFGGLILSAAEKRDAEQMNLLRSVHEQNISELVNRSKQAAIRESAQSVVIALSAVEAAKARHEHWTTLLDSGLNEWEVVQQLTQVASTALVNRETTLRLIAAMKALVPQVGSLLAVTFGGIQLEGSAKNSADAVNGMVSFLSSASQSAGLQAGFQRRSEDWEFQRDLSRLEVQQAKAGLKAAEMRRRMSEIDLSISERQSEHAAELHRFYKDKHSNVALYDSHLTQLRKLHTEITKTAIRSFAQAFDAFVLERGVEPPAGLPTFSGLLAGEQLLRELAALEDEYAKSSARKREVTQSFSLRTFAPDMLLKLRVDGNCTFSLREWMYDVAYRGERNRRIRAVRISIPCVVGPYQNVAATLKLVGNGAATPNKDDLSPLAPTPDSDSIITSSAINDAGLLEFSFHDERYLPFEYRDAVSTWEITLPGDPHVFDYETIADVILHVSYESDGLVDRQLEVPEEIKVLFDLKAEAPEAWNLLRQGKPATVALDDSTLPFFARGGKFEAIKYGKHLLKVVSGPGGRKSVDIEPATVQETNSVLIIVRTN